MYHGGQCVLTSVPNAYSCVQCLHGFLGFFFQDEPAVKYMEADGAGDTGKVLISQSGSEI
jgi:hypothetical protein